MCAGLSIGTHQQSPTDFSILIQFPFAGKHQKNNQRIASKPERHLKTVYNITLIILYVIGGRKPQLCRRGMTLPGQKWLVLSVGSAPGANPGTLPYRGVCEQRHGPRESTCRVGVRVYTCLQSRAQEKACHRLISEQSSGFRCHSRSDQKSQFH